MVKGEFAKGEEIAHNARAMLRLTILRQLLIVRQEGEQWSWERVSCLEMLVSCGRLVFLKLKSSKQCQAGGP